MQNSINSPKYANNGLLTDIVNILDQSKSNSYSDKHTIKKLKV